MELDMMVLVVILALGRLKQEDCEFEPNPAPFPPPKKKDPLILATWEAEIRRILSSRLAWAKVQGTPSQAMPRPGGASLSSQLCGEVRIEECCPGQPRHKARPYSKNRAGGVAQAVEHLPNKCETEFNPQYV
jgi:hypothetical protein